LSWIDGEQVDTMLNDDLLGDNSQLDPDTLFEQHMTTCAQASNNEPIENDVRLKELSRLLTVEATPDEPETATQAPTADEDFAIENSQTDHIPMDPFTRHEVQEPLRNKHCKHVYDKEGITNYINQSRKARCPVIGCNNRQVITFNDLVEDLELSAQIQRIRHRRNAQA
jgi:SUMO ligase MMS21 Smc5/6 complex component